MPTREQDIETLVEFAIYGRGVLSIDKTRRIVHEIIERLEAAAGCAGRDALVDRLTGET